MSTDNVGKLRMQPHVVILKRVFALEKTVTNLTGKLRRLATFKILVPIQMSLVLVNTVAVQARVTNILCNTTKRYQKSNNNIPPKKTIDKVALQKTLVNSSNYLCPHCIHRQEHD